MREIDPSHVKETSFACSLVTKLNTKKLLVVLECLKDRAFDSTDCLRLFVIMTLKVSCGMLTKVCRARINFLNLS